MTDHSQEPASETKAKPGKAPPGPLKRAIRAVSPRAIKRRLKRWRYGHVDDFINEARGVIHVGANTGQERDVYRRAGLNVVWVEPIPHVFAELDRNIAGYRNQRAVQTLLADAARPFTFHVASNGGASSSVFDFGDHSKIWPEIVVKDKIELMGQTLPNMIEREAIELKDHDALLLDTQGSELLILKGAETVLGRFRFIRCEAADFAAYAGGTVRSEIEAFLTARGFRLRNEEWTAGREGVGNYYELLFERGA